MIFLFRQFTKKGDDDKGITPVTSVHDNSVEEVDNGEVLLLSWSVTVVISYRGRP